MLEFLNTDWLVLFAVCLLTALFAVWVASPKGSQSGMGAGGLLSGEQPDPVFLFDDAVLIGRSTAATRILKTCHDPTNWTGIRENLISAFPGLPENPEFLRDNGPMTLGGVGNNRNTEAHCEWIDGITRIHLRPLDTETSSVCSSELQNLRAAMDAAPYPVWRETEDGQISWCNQAYDDLRQTVRGPNGSYADPLFPKLSHPVVAGRKSRISVPLSEQDQRLWFDVSTVKSGDGKLGYAVDINAVVDAEIAQRNFVQTLAKTFAQLSIGLAIFDRNRQLALFNPALIDLTALQADFLSSRPTLFNFFDRLRDGRVMPEPKDYNSWRQQISDLVEAAADGRYQETWSLPSGSVYSVSGRPHPDGAVAFLFEDITAEITLTRRFRSELEQGQAILDQLGQAIAVFSADGTLSFSNEAYHQLWSVDPDASFAQMTVLDACKTWQEKSAPTAVWGRISDFVNLRANRAPWTDKVRLRDGTGLICEVAPIQNGSTMVSFSFVSPGAEQLPARAALQKPD
jgi:PAS domain-containing protein